MSTDQNEVHALPNVVLIHGAWADGSSWSAVIERLQADGYNVTAPQFPLTSLADDVAKLRRVLALQDGPTVDPVKARCCTRYSNHCPRAP